MNIKEVKGPHFCAVCADCGEVLNSYEKEQAKKTPEKVFADLDGKPFAAYYCDKCATKKQGK